MAFREEEYASNPMRLSNLDLEEIKRMSPADVQETAFKVSKRIEQDDYVSVALGIINLNNSADYKGTLFGVLNLNALGAGIKYLLERRFPSWKRK